MIDIAIFTVYIVGLLTYRSWLFFSCFAVYMASLLFFVVSNPDYIDISLSFLVYFSAYLILSLKLFKNNHFSAACMTAIISVYDLLFAMDTFFNHEVETWVYKNHEGFVLIFHLSLVCLFSKKFNTILASSCDNINRVCSNLLCFQFGSSSHERAKSSKGFK